MRTLVFDIEISPHLTYTYDTYEADVIKIVRPQFLLSFAYKWLDEKKVYVVSLPDFKDHYRKKPHDDSLLVAELWKLFDSADILCGHNIRKFDIPKVNARFAYHGLTAPSSYQTIDTLQLARQKFGFPGNSLAKLCEFLNTDHKKTHMGSDEWIGCIEGDMKSWAKNKKYNPNDVLCTEDVYYKLRSFSTNHPNMNAYTGEIACHVCTSKNLIAKGYRVLMSGAKKKRFLCKSCGVMTCERRGENITLLSA